MSYEAKVINIMIASPKDASSERNIIRNTIYGWNEAHSMTERMVLLPVGWESHSSPETGKEPQEIINKQVLGICDLLVGVFKETIGTPTDKYVSGTVEEIEKHIEIGKPAMLYFSTKEVDSENVNAEHKLLIYTK